MPELPEVETVCRGLNQKTLGQTITGGQVLLDRTIAYPFSVPEFLAGLQGTTLGHWQRRGKYLLAELRRPALAHGAAASDAAAGYWAVHLRMTGQLLWLEPTTPLQPHCRVRLFLGDDRELRFVDQRTFGQMWWIPADRAPAEVMPGLAKLGPEPFSSDFSIAYLQQWLTRRHRPIKNALLDQTLVAGIGNIYADEALFLSGIQPHRLCSSLRPKAIERLHGAILQVLQTAIAANGTTFSDFKDVEGVNGNYGGVAWVYDRRGEPCRVCQTVIERIKLAGRSAHFCPTCQS